MRLASSSSMKLTPWDAIAAPASAAAMMSVSRPRSTAGRDGRLRIERGVILMAATNRLTCWIRRGLDVSIVAL